MKENDFLIKKRSKIHGIGIITKKKIFSGEEFYKIPLNNVFETKNKRLARIGQNKYVSDEEVLNYVNHSCNPNSILLLGKSPSLKAIKDILPGEEITVDYRKTEKKLEFGGCNCNSKNCFKN